MRQLLALHIMHHVRCNRQGLPDAPFTTHHADNFSPALVLTGICQATCPGGADLVWSHDSPSENAHLGRGQEAAWGC